MLFTIFCLFQDPRSPNCDMPGLMESSTHNATVIPAAAAAIANLNKSSIADTTATPSLPQPNLPTETAGLSKKKGVLSPNHILRGLIAVALKGEAGHQSKDEILARVNFVCDDLASNAGAAGEERELKKGMLDKCFQIFMGDIQWPTKRTLITDEYRKALTKAVETHAAGKNDLIFRLANLAYLAEQLDSSTADERNESANAEAGVSGADAAAAVTGAGAPASCGMVSDSRDGSDGSSLPAESVSNPLAIPSALAAPRTTSASAAVDGFDPEQVKEIAKKRKSIQEDKMKLECDKIQIQQLKNQLAAKEADLREKQRCILAEERAIAEKAKKYREMLEKKVKEEDRALKDNEAKMAAWVRRVEAGKKRKREDEELLAALGFENVETE